MKVIKIILITLGVVFLILFAIGFIMGFTESKSTPSATDEFSPEYAAYFNEGFMGESMSIDMSGERFNQREYCQCSLDGLKADYSYKELASFGLNKTPEEIEALSQPYISRCMAEQGIEV